MRYASLFPPSAVGATSGKSALPRTRAIIIDKLQGRTTPHNYARVHVDPLLKERRPLQVATYPGHKWRGEGINNSGYACPLIALGEQ
jgi:hypothetical protein